MTPTPEQDAAAFGQRRYLPNSTGCFVCGEDNPAGLRTRFFVEDGIVNTFAVRLLSKPYFNVTIPIEIAVAILHVPARHRAGVILDQHIALAKSHAGRFDITYVPLRTFWLQRNLTPLPQVPLVIPLTALPDITPLYDPLKGIEPQDIRVLLKTRNSRLWNSPEFHQDYVGLTAEGAHYLTQHGVKVVGIDYLSIEEFRKPGAPAHRNLLGSGTIIIEGLNLRDVEPGPYELYCLPLRVVVCHQCGLTFLNPQPTPAALQRFYEREYYAGAKPISAEARMKGYVGEACPECANFTLVRNGTCLKCDTCGSTTGCS